MGRAARLRSIKAGAPPGGHEAAMPMTSALLLTAVPLLALPGPTNALLAAAGAERGAVRAAPLTAIVPLAYALAISGWMPVLAPLVNAAPAMLAALQLAAAGFVLWCAARFWRAPGGDAAGGQARIATPRLVFVTTLLNPKGLMIAIAMLPGSPFRAVHGLLLLAALASSACWLVAGHGFARAAGGHLTPRRLQRITAVSYAAFALILAHRGMGMFAPA